MAGSRIIIFVKTFYACECHMKKKQIKYLNDNSNKKGNRNAKSVAYLQPNLMLCHIVIILWMVFRVTWIHTNIYECSACLLLIFHLYFRKSVYTIHVKKKKSRISEMLTVNVCMWTHFLQLPSFLFSSNCDSECEGCKICLILLLMLVQFMLLAQVCAIYTPNTRFFI